MRPARILSSMTVAGLIVAAGSPALAAGSGNHISLSGSMEGDLAFSTGAYISAGYHFQTSGTAPVSFDGAQVSLPVSCTKGGAIAGTIVVPLNNGPYTPNGHDWTPWHDQSSTNPLPYQGDVQAPNLCNGGTMYNSIGATFDADLQSSDSDAVAVQFHYRIPEAKNRGNVNCNDASAPGATDAATCGASESPTGSATPAPPSSSGSGGSNPPPPAPQSAPKTQTLAAVVDECGTTTHLPGAALSVPDSGLSSGNPMAPQSVTAGNHTVDASLPSGWQFSTSTCGPISNGDHQTVNVPSGGSATATFSAQQTPGAPPAPATTTQTLAGVVYECAGGTMQSTQPIAGATLSAAGPTTVNGHANPLPATSVAAGDFTVSATVPNGWTFVSCGAGTPVVITSSSNAHQPVTVPTGGAGRAVFYAAPAPALPIKVAVNKTNDANLDGTFTKSEIAKTDGEDVTFHVTITNTGTAAGVITAITDLASGVSTDVCSGLIGKPLAAGAAVTCDFTLRGYAPSSSAGPATDTVTAVLAEVGAPTKTVTASSRSTVFPAVLGERVAKTPPTKVLGTKTSRTPANVLGVTLPFTGGPWATLAWLGAFLGVVGGTAVVLGRRRRVNEVS